MEFQTILLTGITGFIAKRIALDALLAGHKVRGSLRKQARGEEVRAALVANGLPQERLADLSFVEVDLTRDEGWDAALAGVDALVHTASPFPLGDKLGEAAIVTPAVDGTRRALEAALRAGVRRVVLTSSMEAVMHGQTGELTEANWSDLEARSVSFYTKSKILAERAAWDFVAAHPEMQLTVINPGMVLGTPMDRHYGSSVSVVERFYRGRDPMLPNVSLPIVALEDVSQAHVAALSRPQTIGKRYMLTERFMSMPEMGRVLKQAYPDRRIPTRVAPPVLIRVIAMFDSSLQAVVHLQNKRLSADNTASRHDQGIDYVAADEAIRRTAAFLHARREGGAQKAA